MPKKRIPDPSIQDPGFTSSFGIRHS